MRDKLVILADKLDREGKHDIASAVDETLQATAAGRPKAPLKGLDDDVKKDLLKFVHKIKENIADSMDALEELFGRLRYFNIVDEVKDLGLDKTLKELDRTHSCVDSAFNILYARTHGKKPSSSDREQMAEDFGPDRKTDRNPLEFFETQSKQQDDDRPEHKQETEEGMGEEELSSWVMETPQPLETPSESEDDMDEDDMDEDLSEEDLESFWDDEPFESESDDETEGE